MLMIFDALCDPMLKILIVASLGSFVFQLSLGQMDEGRVAISILLSFVIVTGITSYNILRCSANLQKMELNAQRQIVSVYRGEKDTISIEATELQVGDIYRIEAGMMVPADSILIQTGYNSINNESKKQDLYSIIVQEELVNGDHGYKYKRVIEDLDSAQCSSDRIINKDEGKEVHNLSNVLYAKSYIVKGQGIAIVCAVGPNTQYGIPVDNIFSGVDSIKNEKTQFRDVIDDYALYMAMLCKNFGIFFVLFFISFKFYYHK